VTYAWENLAGRHIRRITDVERESFVAAMARFQLASGENVDIVFDSGSPGDWLPRAKGKSDAKVFIAQPETDADESIRRRVAASLHPAGITVVTSDRKLQDVVRSHGAGVMTPVAFARLVQRVFEGAQQTPPGFPREKLQGVPDGEIDGWLAYFGCE